MSASTSQTRGYFELILSAHGRRDRCADPKCNAYRDRVIHFPKRYPEIEGVSRVRRTGEAERQKAGGEEVNDLCGAITDWPKACGVTLPCALHPHVTAARVHPSKQSHASQPQQSETTSRMVCAMCGALAVCLSVDNEPPARAVFACGDCCGCAGCANVHDAENPYCEAETGGCWRLFAIPDYVNQLRDDLNALDETTASRIDELEQQLAALRSRQVAPEVIEQLADTIVRWFTTPNDERFFENSKTWVINRITEVIAQPGRAGEVDV